MCPYLKNYLSSTKIIYLSVKFVYVYKYYTFIYKYHTVLYKLDGFQDEFHILPNKLYIFLQKFKYSIANRINL